MFFTPFKTCLGQKWLFYRLKSQNFEILYKIKVKNRTFLYLVLFFLNNRVKVEADRAFSVFVGQTEASEIVSEFFQP